MRYNNELYSTQLGVGLTMLSCTNLKCVNYVDTIHEDEVIKPVYFNLFFNFFYLTKIKNTAILKISELCSLTHFIDKYIKNPRPTYDV